ncbi:MAG: carbohydrate ABC transporter permease [Oscillospiraceae bacterium]
MKAFEKKLSGAVTSMDFKKRSVRIGYWLMILVLVFVSAICLFPPVWVLLSSFKDVSEFLQVPPTIFPKSFHPEKIAYVWDMLNFGKYYMNSVYLAIGELVFCVVFNGLVGYVLSRLKPKGTTLILTLILWTMMLPTSVSMVPLFMSFVDVPYLHINLTNTFLPMWMMAGANAFYVLLFKNFFDSIPMSYVEAARLDGCTNFGIFYRIILPLSKSIIMVVSIFSVNASWENFFWPYLVLKDTNLYTVAVKIFQLKTTNFAIDEYMVVLLLSIIPPAVIFLIFQNYMSSDFAMGGVKG